MQKHCRRVASDIAAWMGVAVVSWWEKAVPEACDPAGGEVKRIDYESFHTFSFDECFCVRRFVRMIDSKNYGRSKKSWELQNSRKRLQISCLTKLWTILPEWKKRPSIW